MRNIASNWGTFAFSAVISFFLSPIVVHKLGDAAYGAWALLVALAGYLGLLDLGVRSAVTRFVARLHAQADHEEASRIASAALAIFTIAGVAAIGIASVLAVLIGPVFNIPPQLLFAARVVAVLGGVNVAVSLLSGVFGGIVVGMQRLDATNGVDVLTEAVRTVAIYVALQEGRGLITLALIQLISSVFRGCAAYVLSRRFYPELHVRIGNWGRTHLRLILDFSIATSLMQASGMLIAYSDSIVISAFQPIVMVTYFSIAVALTNNARVLISGISQAIAPLASSLEGSGRAHHVRDTLLRGSQLATVIGLPIALTFILRGRTFIALWMGEHYAEPSEDVLWVLAASLSFASAYQVSAAALIGIGKHRGLVPIFVCEAIASLFLSILLVQRLGIQGVAWGIGFPRLVVSVIVGPLYIRRILGIPIKTFWLNAWLRPGVSMIPFAALSYVIERVWIASSLTMYFLQVLLTLPTAVAGLWFLGLNSVERKTYASILPRSVRLALRYEL